MKSVWSTTQLALILVSLSLVGFAQEPQTPEPAPDSLSSASVDGSKSAAVEPESFTGRLPRFFASIVDEIQRSKIYEIQRSYRSRIEELESQLTALKQAEQTAIRDVLTPNQLERLEAVRAASRNRLARNRSLAPSFESGESPEATGATTTATNPPQATSIDKK